MNKHCPRCSEDKPLSDFGVRGGTRKGKPKAWCRACENIAQKNRYFADAEKSRAKNRRQYQLNSERCREKSRRWRANNRVKVKAQNNKASTKRAQKQWYKNNYARVLENTRNSARRRIIGRNNTDAIYWVENVLINDPCSYCGRKMEQIDHITPLFNGGSNAWDNLTAACESCNKSKGTKPVLIWMQSALS